MDKADLPAVAVIADAHFHDMDSDYGWDGLSLGGRHVCLRSWKDTRRSSRVFNESKAALELALRDIRKRGITYVVLLGDYSDDGQIEATDRLIELLHQHRDRYGTRFFAITGNHDAYGPLGKHQSTRFASGNGDTVLVTSDPTVAATEPESAVLTQRMYCEGVPSAISKMSEFGLFKQPDYLHWETPFGLDDALETRLYDACSADQLSSHQLVDASYLVEPEDGLWLLMIDANVFEPRNGQRKPSQKKAFLDSSDAGWNSVLKNRPHLLDWITDVSTRADQKGKRLVAFSHYPTIDHFADTNNNAQHLFGDNEMLRRKPDESVSEKLLAAGIQLHFSGHLHVSALSQRSMGSQSIEDCAVPSLAAFPAGYKIVHNATDKHGIDTILLSSMPLDPLLIAHYQEENAKGCDTDNAVLEASDYGEFLYRRMHSRVIHHYLHKEWPTDIALSVMGTSAADLAMFMLSDAEASDDNSSANLTSADSSSFTASMAISASAYGISVRMLEECSMIRLVSDWYCLRHAGCLARPFISPANVRIYQFLAESFGNLTLTEEATPKTFFTVFLGMLNTAIERSNPTATRERVLSA
ncbi:MAG: metallophosphoesterase [Granulosicoccus sp.]